VVVVVELAKGFPQFKQKRASDGLEVLQFEQIRRDCSDIRYLIVPHIL
jgi:hypothetical protein